MGTDHNFRQRIQRASMLVLALAVSAGGAASAQDSSPGIGTSPALAMASASPGASAGTPREVVRNESGAINACELLTAVQIEGVVGSPVVVATPYGGTECRWTVGPLTAMPGRADPWLDALFYENELPMLHVEEDAGLGGVTAIEGLGDRAFRTSQYRHLWVQHGQDVFVVRSGLVGLSDDTEASQTAAEAIELLFARLILDQL